MDTNLIKIENSCRYLGHITNGLNEIEDLQRQLRLFFGKANMLRHAFSYCPPIWKETFSSYYGTLYTCNLWFNTLYGNTDKCMLYLMIFTGDLWVVMNFVVTWNVCWKQDSWIRVVYGFCQRWMWPRSLLVMVLWVAQLSCQQCCTEKNTPWLICKGEVWEVFKWLIVWSELWLCSDCFFILEFACFQGRKLSGNRLCTVGLTITSGDVTGTGVGIVTALAFPLIMQCRYAMCFRGIFSSVNTEKTPCGSPVRARYGVSFVDSWYDLCFGFLILCYFRCHGIFNLFGLYSTVI